MPWESSSLTGEFYFLRDGQSISVPDAVKAVQQKNSSKDAGPNIGQNYRIKSIQLDIIAIEKGDFSMGSSKHNRDEKPLHEVNIQSPFWMAKYEVTQEQYKSVMKKNPSTIKGDAHPVETVTWLDAVNFCKALNSLEDSRLPKGYEYRLPTEAEWEYVAKAGKENYNIEENNNICWHKYNSEGAHHKAGSKSSNPWGVYDMLGNVWEWVYDSYDSDFYSKANSLKTYSNKGKVKVIRGGSWYDNQRFCRPGNRNHYEQDIKGDILGFRIVLGMKL
jgi:formylglycine-generating enzyme required for sulfatase activity